jgi:hypothetical protein
MFSGVQRHTILTTLILLGCGNDRRELPSALVEDACRMVTSVRTTGLPDCLHSRGIISPTDRDSSLRLLTRATEKEILFRSLKGTHNFERAERVSRSLDLVDDMHRRGQLADSARFHRIMDVVSVALDVAEGHTRVVSGRLRPTVTPHLTWYDYARVGAFFQPVTTSQRLAHLLPRESVPLDTLLAIADELYRYALWRQHGALRFPVWEYQFRWTSGGITVDAPWISGMSQGLVMSLFTEVYRRTRSPAWKDRAYEAFHSFRVSWSNGGVMLDDTTHGYWWEEFHPDVMIWNGSVQALVDVGFLWIVTGDSTVKRMFDRGIESLKYFTPKYDTGRWTLYSLTQGHNSVAYHNYHVELLDVLYRQTGDIWFKTTADRWRKYRPPERGSVDDISF